MIYQSNKQQSRMLVMLYCACASSQTRLTESSGKLVAHAEAPLHPWKGPGRDAREVPYVQAWQLEYDFLSGHWCAPSTALREV